MKRSAPRHQSHAYVDDETPDHRGQTRCAVCGLGKEHSVHQWPTRSTDEAAAEAARMGERE